MRPRALVVLALVPFGCVRDLPSFVGPAEDDAGVDTGAIDSAFEASDEAGVDAVAADACRSQGPGAPLVIWRYGGGEEQYVDGLAVDSNGNAIISGSFFGTMTLQNGPVVARGADAFVASVDPGGHFNWSLVFGDDGNQFGTRVAASGGAVLVAAQFQGTISHLDADASVTSPADGFDDGVVLRLDGNTGAIGRHVVLGGPGVQQVNDVAFVNTGVVLVADFTNSFPWADPPSTLAARGQYDAFIGRTFITAGFGHDWGGKASGGEPSNQRVGAVAVDGAGSIYAVGHFQNSLDVNNGVILTAAGGAADTDAFVAKLSNGNVIAGWPKRYGDSVAEQRATLVAITDDASSDILVAGQFGGSIDLGGGTLTSKGDFDIFLARLGPDGTHRFSLSFGSAGADTPSALVVDGAGNILLAGDFNRAGLDLGGGVLPYTGGVDGFAVKLKAADGAHVWSRAFGSGAAADSSAGTDQHITAIGASPQAVFVAGYFNDKLVLGSNVSASSAGLNDGYVAKLCP